MHLIIATRGNKRDVDDLITQLQGQYLPTDLCMKDGKPDPTGKPEKYHLQTLVRPIQLWDLGIPKEHLDLWLNTLDCVRPENKRYKGMQWIFNWVRKRLGLKDIPEKYDKTRLLPVSAAKKNTDIIALGTKDDYHNINGTEGI